MAAVDAKLLASLDQGREVLLGFDLNDPRRAFADAYPVPLTFFSVD
jgi:hypothetical protein